MDCYGKLLGYENFENIKSILQIGLFREIDLVHVPGLFRLLNDGEMLDDLRRLSPEQILIRWVNYHLQNVCFLRFIFKFINIRLKINFRLV